MTDLYKKVNNRYQKIGVEFTGFPANGYWVVLDGTQTLLAPIEHPRPIEANRFLQYREQLLQDALINNTEISLYQLITRMLLKLEELNNESLSRFNG